jgi:NSS family neurotransmitter:Na+ symporter
VRRDAWTSPFAFLYAAAAAAIGLGSLWRFPYVAGANGGGLFVLLYIVFVAVLCAPLMIAEMSIGRRGHASAVKSVDSLVEHERVWRGWRLIGWLSILIPFFGLSYYSVVAGWALDYTRVALFQGFAGYDGARSLATFSELMASPVRAGLVHALFLALVVVVVARGVQRGIEWISRIKMAALLVILIGLVIYNATAHGLSTTLRFLFVPDFSAFRMQSVLTALGQALFSTAIGVGVMITYSSYLPRDVSLPRMAALICASVVIAAMLAGLAIFPAVFAYGLRPAEGPNLIFVTLPVAFGQMPGGGFISVMFFGLIALAAFTTAVGMLEPVSAWVMERLSLSRAKAAVLTGLAIWAVGLPSLLSFSVLKDFHPLDGLTVFANKTIFDLLDLGIANVMLPLNALLIALFIGWAVRQSATGQWVAARPLAMDLWRFALRIVAPVAIAVLLVSSWR